MALTRSSLRQVSYLLEVAPLASPKAVPSNAFRSSTQCFFRRPQRRFQSGRPAKKPAAKSSSVQGSDNPTAQNRLLGDLGLGNDNARPRSVSKEVHKVKETSPDQAVLERLNQVLSDAQLPLKRDRVVGEKQAIESLRICFDLARAFTETPTNEKLLTPAMDLLFDLNKLPAEEKIKAARARSETIQDPALQSIESTAYRIVADPKVFITPELLKMYVVFKGYMDKPQDLPEVFHLYANKPIPDPKSSPVKFKSASPDRPVAAIDLEVANAALDAAINVQDLPLCLDIIDKTVRTKAFRNHKFVSQGLIPTLGVVAAPFAAFVVASQFAVFQQHMTSSNATWVGFAGVSSYLLFTGTIGFVALTTANDQMKRVTWADGMPLRERWIREPERAMLDKVACAWGFKSSTRWGEEEGPEWDALKQLVGIRSMVLDRVELMEGMN